MGACLKAASAMQEQSAAVIKAFKEGASKMEKAAVKALKER